MDCCEFREKYSDFADGLLDEQDQARARRHLGVCAACRRFDAAFQLGVNALRDLPSVEVSRSFGERLRGRIRHEVAVRGLAVDPLSGALAALLVMVTVGLVSWDLVELRAARRAAPVATASAPEPVVQVPAPITIRLDTALIFRTAVHPFDPSLLVADTDLAPYAAQARVDVPAVWGGR